MINVPWDSAYKDIVQFDDLLARDAWLDAQAGAAMATNRMSYLGPAASIVLPCPVTTAERYNYLYVDNPYYAITDDIDSFVASPRRYCYFITDVQYLSPAACLVALQLDVWTSWAPFCRFTRAFLAQGHAAIANANLWDGRDLRSITPEKMRRYLSAPEPVDAGGEYLPIFTSWTDLSIPAEGTQGTFIGVMSSVDLAEAWGSTTNPNIKSASGSIQEGMLAGVQVIYFKTSDFISLLDELRDAPWVSRNIMQVWLAPGRMTAMYDAGTIHGRTYYRPTTGSPSDYYVATLDAATQLASHFDANKTVAPKMLTAPYSFIELNAFEGSPLVIKPQRASSLTSMQIAAQGLTMAPWDRIAIYPLYYGAGDVPGDVTYSRQNIQGQTVSDRLHKGDFLDAALWISDLPRFSFTSDGYLAWLAAGAHSRAWSYQHNDWNYHKAALNRELGYEQTTAGLDLARNQNFEQQTLWQQQFIPKTAMQVMGSLGADPIATAGNLAKVAMDAAMSQQSQALSQEHFKESNELAQKQADQNYALAGYAMQGDYEQQIASLSATQRDAEITAPSVVGAAGGQGWNYAMGLLGFRTTIKVPTLGQQKILLNFFKRFGYTINEIIDMPWNLRLMEHFTYWKLQEAVLSGGITEGAKNAIRGIFERGTTVWAVPEEIPYLSWASSNGIASTDFRY